MKCRVASVVVAVGAFLTAGSVLGAGCDLPGKEPGLIFGTSYEITNVISGDDCFNVSGNAPTRSAEKSRSGGYGMRSYLHRYDSNTNYRTEVRAKAAPTSVGKEYWYGFSIFLPSPYPADRDIEEILAQWHATPDANDDNNNPPLALYLLDGRWRMWTKWNSSQPTIKSRNGSSSFDLGAQEVDKWTDWVVHVKWSYGSDGFLQVWRNGNKVVDRTGPNAYNDQIGPYFKMGIYKSEWRQADATSPTNSRTLFHDDFRMTGASGSYNDVAPGGGGDASKPNPPTQLSVN